MINYTKIDSISSRERRHILLALQAEIHGEIAPELNKRLAAEWEKFKTSKALFIPFAPIDYVAADVAIVAELTAEHARPAEQEACQASAELVPA